MGRHNEDSMSPNSSTSNVYPEQLQLKLYQAFIFSIPILFSIILFLLFYLFYLKRRALTLSSNPSSNHHHLSDPSFLSPGWIQGELKDKLNVVLFDQEMSSRDSLCCVCLGEFEMKEELRQLPLCRHVFHADCIRHWLRANATCPLCRHPVLSATKLGHPIGPGPARGQGIRNYIQQTEQQHAQVNMPSSSNATGIASTPVEHVVGICDAILHRQ